MSTPVTPEDWLKLREETRDVIEQVAKEVGGLPSVLLPYQQEAVRLLDAPGTEVLVVEKSRRIGLTWGLAAHAVLKAARSRSAGGMDALYISYAQEMTREFVDACAMWARAYSIAASDAEEFLFEGEDGNDTRSIQAFRIRFASGFEVVGLSSAPRTLRGKQGLCIIDEAAFVDSLAELQKAALAFLMWGGQVVVCSTHNGVDNSFNQLVQDVLGGRLPYKHLRIDFDDALRAGLYQRICLVRGLDWTAEGEVEWRAKMVAFYGDGADEELFCIPALGSGQWLSGPLIESRMTADCPILRWELPPDFLQRPEAGQQAETRRFMDEVERAVEAFDADRRHALGFDFARVADLSVVWVFMLDKVLRRVTVLVVEMRRVPHREQAAVVRLVIKSMPKPMGAAFDATGAGEYVAEEMAREFGAAPKDGKDGGGFIAQIKLSQDWYRTEMPPVKTWFEDASIALPRDDEILSDLRLVKVIKGIPMVPPLRTGEPGRKRHGDAAVAIALAGHATRMRVEEYGYQAATRADRDDGRLRDRADDDADDLPVRGWWTGPMGAGIRGAV